MEVYRGNTYHVSKHKLNGTIYYCVARNMDTRIIKISRNLDDAISRFKEEENRMTIEKMFPNDERHGGYYDFDKANKMSTNEIKNHIWSAVNGGQPIPGCLNLKCLRDVLVSRGEDPHGYHNT